MVKTNVQYQVFIILTALHQPLMNSDNGKGVHIIDEMSLHIELTEKWEWTNGDKSKGEAKTIENVPVIKIRNGLPKKIKMMKIFISYKLNMLSFYINNGVSYIEHYARYNFELV